MLITSLEELRLDAEVRRIRGLAPSVAHLSCVLCGSRKRGLVGHHETYLRPYDVIPLCSRHHQLRHKRLRERERDPVTLYMAARRAGTACPLPPALSPTEAVSLRWSRARAS